MLTVWAFSITPINAFWDGRLLIFCVIGLFVPGLSRLFLIISTERVGAARSSSIRATGPLIATLAAILWLKEMPTFLNSFGILTIVTGGYVLSKRSQSEPLWQKSDLIYPIAGTFLTAMRDVAVRFGLSEYSYPIAGAWAATFVSFIVVLLYRMWRHREGESTPPLKAWLYYGLLGIAVTIGFTTLFFALISGQVVIVSPITATNPLFTLLLSALFLKDLERITVRILIGAFLIFTGVILLTL